MLFDLHCHTKLSDGSTDLEEIITLAAKSGIKGLAITDHDTFAGCGRAVALGKCAGIEVIPGVEISTKDTSRNKRAHILCYAPQNPEPLFEVLKKINDGRREAMIVSIKKIVARYPISEDMILKRAQGSTNLFKQHVMHAFMDAGYTTQMFGELFSELFDSKNGFAATHIDYPDVFDIINKVHDAGGAAVLAHPSEYKSMELLEELCEKRLIDGIEVEHPRNKEEEKEEMRALSRRFEIPMTGGTDFHGFYTKRPCPIGSFTTDEEQVLRLKKAAGSYHS